MQELSSEDKRMIEESWKRLAPNIYGLAVSFYKELFTINESLVPGYDTIDIQKQAEKALMTFSFLISVLDNLDDSKKRIKKLVESHIQDHEDIKPDDFVEVKKAILISMGINLKGNWSRPHAVAWHRLMVKIEALWIEKDLPKQSYDFPVFKV